MRMTVAAAALCALSLGVACTPVSKEEKQELAKPVDCTTARGDIRVLKSERNHVVQRIAEGVTSIYPAAAVIGIVRGVEKDKLEVAVGEYNKKIDEKVKEIKANCEPS